MSRLPLAAGIARGPRVTAIAALALCSGLWLHGRCTRAATTGAAEPQRRALLVAVTGYDHHSKDPDRDWPELNTEPDVVALEAELKARYPGIQIEVLDTPAETTKANILREFRRFLIDQTRPGKGDVVYFHFSGHGSEVPDDGSLPGGITIGQQPDGYDRTIVPSDYVSKDYTDTNGLPACNDIRNDDMRILLLDLAKKDPADVFLSFDCCHAGGNTRGAHLLRGDFWRGRPSKTADAAYRAKLLAAQHPGPSIFDNTVPGNRGYVVLAATRSDELDSETDGDDGKPLGSLSYALAKAFGAVGRDASYRDIYDEVVSIMAQKAPNQNPEIEGPIYHQVLDGTTVAPQIVMPVVLETKKHIVGLTPVLRAGYLQGMTVGSKIALRWAGAAKDSAPIATAALKAVSALESTFVVDTGSAKTDAEIVAALQGTTASQGTPGTPPRAVQAVLTERHFPDNPLVVDVSPVKDRPDFAALQTNLAPLEKEGLIQLTEGAAGQTWNLQVQPPVWPPPGQVAAVRGGSPAGADATHNVVRNVPANWMVLARSTDGSLIVPPAGPNLESDPTRAIPEAINTEARRGLFSEIANSDPDQEVDVQFRFVPLDPSEIVLDTDGNVTAIKRHPGIPHQPASDATPHMKSGTYAVLEVRNTGVVPAWITILNLRGDGKIGAVYPQPGIATDNRITTADYDVPAEKRAWIRPEIKPGLPYVFQFTDRDDSGNLYPTRADIYKAIVTSATADFSMLVDADTIAQRGEPDPSKVRGNDTPLGRLLRSAAMNTRGNPVSAPPSGWSVASVALEIDPE
jgi:hypothetical protein